MPSNMRINSECELTAVELPKAILAVFARADEMFKAMRDSRHT